ncbi:hypothetical protein GGP70_003156 [Salinibacter ruber]|nr:hypothetical protein [Salinibacter ruber]
MRPVSGGEWLRPTGEREAEGMVKFHKRDRSRFQARKAS